MSYYKRFWDETTGEELTNSWGKSTYYFETDHDHYVVRQIQLFENQKALRYTTQLLQDDYGSLSDQPLDADDFRPFLIEREEFELVWLKNCENDIERSK
jgi:hypothetical protein